MKLFTKRREMNIKLGLTLQIILCLPVLYSCEPESSLSISDEINKELSIFSTYTKLDQLRDDCHDVYSKLYNKEMLRVSIFLGLLDNNFGRILDNQAKSSIIEHLLKECGSGYYACGFSLKKNKPTILEKTTIDKKKITISIYDSSINGTSTSKELKLSKGQQKKSELISETFLKSINKDDIVFYIGHSKYGTGPGFYYLPFPSSQWRTAYFKHPSLKATVRALKEAATPPKLLGLFGCSSQRYYAYIMHKTVPKTALIVSNHMTIYDTNIAEAIVALNSIFGNMCFSEFEGSYTSLHTNSQYMVYGLFNSNSFPIFKKNNQLIIIVAFLISLPIFSVIISTFSNTLNITSLEDNIQFIDILWLFLLVFVGALITKYLSNIFTVVDKHSIPLFFYLTSIFLFFIFTQKKYPLKTSINNVLKSSIAPLTLSLLIYIGINTLPEAEINQFVVSTPRLIIFLVSFFILIPFSLLSISIIIYPLKCSSNIHFFYRFLFFTCLSILYYGIITFILGFLNVYIFHYSYFILSFFIYYQIILFLINYLKLSTILAVISQAVMLAIIFSENIHLLFYTIPP